MLSSSALIRAEGATLTQIYQDRFQLQLPKLGKLLELDLTESLLFRVAKFAQSPNTLIANACELARCAPRPLQAALQRGLNNGWLKATESLPQLKANSDELNLEHPLWTEALHRLFKSPLQVLISEHPVNIDELNDATAIDQQIPMNSAGLDIHWNHIQPYASSQFVQQIAGGEFLGICLEPGRDLESNKTQLLISSAKLISDHAQLLPSPRVAAISATLDASLRRDVLGNLFPAGWVIYVGYDDQAQTCGSNMRALLTNDHEQISKFPLPIRLAMQQQKLQSWLRLSNKKRLSHLTSQSLKNWQKWEQWASAYQFNEPPALHRLSKNELEQLSLKANKLSQQLSLIANSLTGT